VLGHGRIVPDGWGCVKRWRWPHRWPHRCGAAPARSVR
jgi:hypothetical protein